MDIKRSPVYGTMLEQNPMHVSRHPFVSIPGTFKGQQAMLPIDEETLSKHLLLIGGTGCGKTNAFYHFVSQIKRQMTSKDVMIIFDTKGDYYEAFAKPGDLMIGNSSQYESNSCKWNIFREIAADGLRESRIAMNAQEISWAVFREVIEKSKDPFFPNAARDLFSAILLCMLQTASRDAQYGRQCLNNEELKRAFEESTILDIKSMLESFPKLAAVTSYIGDGSNGQALGVYAELLGTIRKILVGVFAAAGNFSIREFVRQRGCRTLFVEYDLSIGNVLAPVYSLLFDLALKETLGRNCHDGNVYLVCDEFRLLPHLQHIDDGVNFGRSLGLKVIAGLQSISQLAEVYQEHRGKNIVAGFSTVVAFKANDVATREYVTNLHGKSIVMEQSKTLANSVREEMRNANVVEDWELNSLQIGEAVISIPFGRPFKFRFDLFPTRGN